MRKLIIILCTFIVAAGIIGGCVLTAKEAGVSDKNSKSSEKTEVKWQDGFTKTKWGTYIPDSFNTLYKTIKYDKMYQDIEEAFGGKAIFTEKETKELIAKMNKTTPQDYPPGAMLSPFNKNINEYPYVNAIIYIPNTTLNQTTISNLGLTKVQYEAIENDIVAYHRNANEEDLSKPSQIEIMEINCRLSQVPSQIHTLTKMPIILEQYLPILKMDSKGILEVLYRRASTTNLNSQYLYVMDKDGGCISFAGTYDKKGNLNKEANKVPVKQVDRVIYLFFVFDREIKYSERDKGGARYAYIYYPKLVVFNIVK